MDSMYSAIKSRRGGLLEDSGHEEMGQPQESGMDMKNLVGALSDDQKMQLLRLLVGGASGSKEQSQPLPVAEGGQSEGEAADLEESLGEGHESEDEIAESMLSSSDKMRSERGDQPRNLGERMKFNLSKKLKGKGK